MKTRIKEYVRENGGKYYKPQFKGWLFWHTYGDYHVVIAGGVNEWTTPHICPSLETARAYIKHMIADGEAVKKKRVVGKIIHEH